MDGKLIHLIGESKEVDEEISSHDEENNEIEGFFKTEPGKNLDRISNVFRNRINLIKQTINRVYPELEEEHRNDMELLEDAIKKFKEENDTGIDYDKILHILKTSNIPFVNIFIKGMFLNVFSELDTFTGNYLYALFKMKPEVIMSNQKQFTASEIFECDSIDDFREKVVQKEIETFKRESYIEQIGQLERIFKIDTLRNFENWSNYVEITQRRNIIMHCDGVVTDQYYNICNKNGSKAYTKVGNKLDVDYDYLINAISIVEEVSIKLIQVLWRKCFKDTECKKEFDIALNDYIYQLLLAEEWELAKELGDFAYNIISATTGEYQMLFLVNYCIALNNLEKTEETIKLLEKVDFSAAHREFLLAKYVLMNDIENAVKIMDETGDKGLYFKQQTYATFPLFSHIRHEDKFQKKFKEIFGEDINKEEIKFKIKENEEGLISNEDAVPIV